jgi:predicted ATPase
VATPPGDGPASAAFVSLAEVAEPGRLFEVILRALGVLPTSGREPLDQLEDVLAARPGTLLILDNFEQLVEEGAVLVRALLARAPVKLLVTSRQKLRLEGEQEFRLAPLPVPTEGVGRRVKGVEADKGAPTEPYTLHPTPSCGA